MVMDCEKSLLHLWIVAYWFGFRLSTCGLPFNHVIIPFTEHRFETIEL